MSRSHAFGAIPPNSQPIYRNAYAEDAECSAPALENAGFVGMAHAAAGHVVASAALLKAGHVGFRALDAEPQAADDLFVEEGAAAAPLADWSADAELAFEVESSWVDDECSFL
eukprot:tig00021234_g19384.t1